MLCEISRHKQRDSVDDDDDDDHIYFVATTCVCVSLQVFMATLAITPYKM